MWKKFKEKFNSMDQQSQNSVRRTAEVAGGVVAGLTIFSLGAWVLRRLTGN